MCDEVETVKGFCYLGNSVYVIRQLNACGRCEASVTARTRLGWKKFRECSEILFGKRFSLPIKKKTYKSYLMLNQLQVCYMEVKRGV